MKSFKDALKILEASKEFNSWKGKNPDAYLSYAFFIVGDEDADWKIGYYHKENDRITSFNVGKAITIDPDEEVLKKENVSKVRKLEIDHIKMELSDAVTIASGLQQEEFSTESPRKIIAILQKIDVGQVWNITFLTQSYNTLNFKIKSENGEVVEKKLSPLFQFEQGK